jgi:predicted nucleotidyltransferase
MPDRRFFQKEIIEASKIGSGAVQRELVKLVDAGLVQVESEGSLKRYQINQQASVFEELKSIFEKTVGLALPLRTALKPMEKRISLAFVYGSVAKGGDRAASDIDLLVVSDDLSLSDLYERLMPVERRLGRTLNLTLYTEAEYEREKQFSFLKSVLAGKRIILIGENSDSGSHE